MTYVGASHEFLVFGGLDQAAGYLHDTWTWRSGCWTEHTSQTGPTARAHPAMAYDRKRGFVVLTGGDSVTPDGKKSFPHDTWLWDGSSWTQAAASPPTAMPLLTYDDDLQSIILVSFNTLSADGSSFNGAGYQAQIWSWSGALWTKVASPTSGPPSRIQASAAFDPTHHQLLLFGGATDSQTLGDTWTWDGATWTQIHVSNNPSPRADATMAYLDATKTVQLFGGGQSDQWAWNGVAWVRVIPLHTPSVRTGEAAASDGTHLLLFGGADPNGNNDIWAWDGSDWAIQ